MASCFHCELKHLSHSNCLLFSFHFQNNTNLFFTTANSNHEDNMRRVHFSYNIETPYYPNVTIFIAFSCNIETPYYPNVTIFIAFSCNIESPYYPNVTISIVFHAVLKHPTTLMDCLISRMDCLIRNMDCLISRMDCFIQTQIA